MDEHPSLADRRERFREAARSFGLSFDPAADDDALIECPRLLFNPDGFATLENAMHCREGGTLLLAGDLQYGSGKQHTILTVVCAESEDLDLPPFWLHPEHWLGSLLAKHLCGAEDIDLHESPEFSRRYFLNSPYDETRALFGGRLADLLARHPGLRIQARGTRIGIVHPDEICEPEHLEDFLKLALEIVQALREEGRREAATRRSGRSFRKPDARADLGRVSDRAGRRLRERLVTREELEAALAQLPPRHPSPAIWNQVAGSRLFGAPLWAIHGAACLLALAAVLVAAEGPARAPLTAAILVLLTGGLAVAYRLWLRGPRLVRNGVVTTGTVGKIVRSLWPEQYRVPILYRAGGAGFEATVTVDEMTAVRATRRRARGLPVLVLHDPDRPRRIMLTESLITASTLYD